MVKDAILGGIDNVISFVRDILRAIEDSVDKLLLALADLMKPVLSFLDGLKQDIIDWFKDIIDAILSIPTAFMDMLKTLFIPSVNPFDKLTLLLKSKFPLIEQIGNLLKAVVFSGSGAVPMFTITYLGQTVSIVDFDTFLPYMTFVHLLIIAIAYYRFYIRLRNRLPAIIGGFYT